VGWAPAYATLEQGRQYLQVPADNQADDAWLMDLLASASRAVDATCNRQFGWAAATRTYPGSDAVPLTTGEAGWLLGTTDITELLGATVSVGGLVLDASAYAGYPRNNVADGRPFTGLLLAAAPTADVAITTTWGWLAVPPQVTSATLLQMSRWHVRRQSPYGTAGTPGDGSEMRLLARLDPDVATLLVGLVRPRDPQ